MLATTMKRLLALIPILLIATACDERLGTNFGVAPPDIRLAITGQPSNVVANAAISPLVQVTAQNATGQPVTTSNPVVSIALVSGTGTAGAVLGGTTEVQALSGVANFNNLRINLAGTGYRIIASAPGMAAATSNPFDVTP